MEPLKYLRCLRRRDSTDYIQAVVFRLFFLMNQRLYGIICYCSQQAESEYTNQVIEASQQQASRERPLNEWWAPLTGPALADGGGALSHSFLQTCFYFLVLFSYKSLL
jgi:hypothetical protein